MEPKKRKLWDNYRVIGEVRKGEKYKFVVGAATRNGFRFVTIREFYYRKYDETWQAGKDGLTIPIITPLDRRNPVNGKLQVITPMKNLLAMLPKALEVASTMELADPENELWFTPKQRPKDETNQHWKTVSRKKEQ